MNGMGNPCGLTPMVIVGVGDFVANPLATHTQEIPLVTPGSKEPAQPISYLKMEVAMPVVHFAHFLHKQVNITHNLVFGCRTT